MNKQPNSNKVNVLSQLQARSTFCKAVFCGIWYRHTKRAAFRVGLNTKAHPFRFLRWDVLANRCLSLACSFQGLLSVTCVREDYESETAQRAFMYYPEMFIALKQMESKEDTVMHNHSRVSINLFFVPQNCLISLCYRCMKIYCTLYMHYHTFALYCMIFHARQNLMQGQIQRW